VSIVISDGDESLEASTLTGTSLLLNWRNLQNFILESRQQMINDFGFLEMGEYSFELVQNAYLDWQRVEIDLFNLGDFAFFD
jgi:hypothetical protein